MAVRTMLRWTGFKIQEMTTGQGGYQQTWIRRAMGLYYSNPSVTLSVVTDAGNISPSMVDSRRTAGAAITGRTSSYAGEGTTEEPGTTTVTYDRIAQTVASTTQPSNANSIGYPAYYSNGGFYAMTWQDMVDTFFQPAAVALRTDTLNGVAHASESFPRHQYFINTTYNQTGYTRISNTPVFVDTRADTSLYTAAGIPESIDQPETISSWYLKRRDNIGTPNAPVSGTVTPLYISSAGVLKQYTVSEFDDILEAGIRHYFASGSGIRYQVTTDSTLSGGVQIRGTMTDTVLNGSGNFQTLLASADDYRSQEFPNGNDITESVYRLYYKTLTT